MGILRALLTHADGSSGSEEWGNADVLKLTKNGTGNNAFPSFSSDGSEVSFCLSLDLHVHSVKTRTSNAWSDMQILQTAV